MDRFSKIIILKNFSDKTFYINDVLNFNLVWNTGIGFGLLSSNSGIFYNIITFVIGSVIIFITYLIIQEDLKLKLIFSLIAGGALGNFYDRITYYAVPDFIDFHYENFHWFTFNIADIFISVGIILLILDDLFLKKK